MRLNWNDTLAALQGVAAQSAAPVPEAVTGVSTDHRQTRPGDLFFCIRGERFDGRDFADRAVEQGAVAVVTDRPVQADDLDVPVISVDDVVPALGRLAHAWRLRTSARVVGITGTAGKTTVKELLAFILSRQAATARNDLNLNNQIGLPRSILDTRGDEAFWVLEAGISRPGDMDELGAVLCPDLAVILNAGSGHTEGLGQDVARHKARLLHWLTPGGVGLVCADYPDLVREAQAQLRPGARLHFFSGRSVSAEKTVCQALYEGPEEPADSGALARGRFRVCLKDWSGTVTAPFRGGYGAENIAAAAAAASILGLGPETVAEAVAGWNPPRQRFTCIRRGGWLVVDDSYNANPLSAARMIESATDLAAHHAGGAPLICLLGEMLELGGLAGPEHARLGDCLARSRARLIFWKGGQADAVRAGLDRAGYEGRFVVFDAADSVPDRLFRELAAMNIPRNKGVILIKGSRGNRLEDCVAALSAALEPPDAV